MIDDNDDTGPVIAAARERAGLTRQGLMCVLPRSFGLTEADIRRIEAGRKLAPIGFREAVIFACDRAQKAQNT